MFEYNADTPTSLLEAAVVQWQWLEQVEGLPNRDQFNWIHEELITRFSVLQQQSGKTGFHLPPWQMPDGKIGAIWIILPMWRITPAGISTA